MEKNCTGSCKEKVPTDIYENGGKYTQSARTVIHHPNAVCHYIDIGYCSDCHAIPDWEKRFDNLPNTDMTTKDFIRNLLTQSRLQYQKELEERIENLDPEWSNLDQQEGYDDAIEDVLQILKD